jgi:hypothetical protein
MPAPRPRLLAPDRASTLRLIALTAISLASLATLTACGSSASDAAHNPDRQVASLPSSTGRPSTGDTSSADGAAGSGRPQLRLDDSEERRDRIINAWDQCLLEHGAKTGGPGALAPPGEDQPVFIANPIPQGAKNACIDKQPLGPPELNPELNPHYREDWQKDVACLRSKGMKVHLGKDTSDNPNGLSWTFDDDYVDTGQNTSAIEDDCQRKAFSGQ